MISGGNEITLSDYWIERCRDLGERIVDNYRNGRCNGSRDYSFGGFELEPESQAFARMGEVAFCLWADLDPDSAMSWSGMPDRGYDVIFRGYLVDVKTIKYFKKYLLWPVTKNKIYLSKQFQMLVLVKGDIPSFDICGWIDKAAFYCEHRSAEGESGLIESTWHMPETELWTMEKLLEFTARNVRSA